MAQFHQIYHINGFGWHQKNITTVPSNNSTFIGYISNVFKRNKDEDNDHIMLYVPPIKPINSNAHMDTEAKTHGLQPW